MKHKRESYNLTNVFLTHNKRKSHTDLDMHRVGGWRRLKFKLGFYLGALYIIFSGDMCF